MSDIDDSLERRVSTAGKALPCTELKLVSMETGDIVETGVPGEICARGYMLMKGYDREPEATARAIDSEGWFRTGDLGVMQEDGYIRICGRSKDMIIRGGENIYPREIEEFLYTHTSGSGKSCWHGFASSPERTQPRRKSGISAATESRTSRSRSPSGLWIHSPPP
jgi:fatty-acyl-CoA synthase